MQTVLRGTSVEASQGTNTFGDEQLNVSQTLLPCCNSSSARSMQVNTWDSEEHHCHGE